MKECFKCRQRKPLSEFYKHTRMADGHLNKCKDCTKIDVREHWRKNDSVREYDRKRGSRQTLEYLREYRQKYPNKYKAHAKVYKAVRYGKIVKPVCCEECGSDFRIEAHHDDYLKPLEVRWLCSRCHSLWHVENGEALNP